MLFANPNHIYPDNFGFSVFSLYFCTEMLSFGGGIAS